MEHLVNEIEYEYITFKYNEFTYKLYKYDNDKFKLDMLDKCGYYQRSKILSLKELLIEIDGNTGCIYIFRNGKYYFYDLNNKSYEF